jgi:molybdopterin adenylyltransferase
MSYTALIFHFSFQWLVLEARKVSDDLASPFNHSNPNHCSVDDVQKTLQALDAMGYDEAAEYVYGMHYPEWKERHATKATQEQMDKFNESKPIWASHNKQLLAKRAEPTEMSLSTTTMDTSHHRKLKTSAIAEKMTQSPAPLLSNVCCQPMEDDENQSNKLTSTKESKTSKSRSIPTYQAPDPPAELSLSLGILTVSDRASSGEYKTGDLSGPAVQQAVSELLSSYDNNNNVRLLQTKTAIVSDDFNGIQSKLKEWSDGDDKVDLILTTGGTGFSPRDVTPEATEKVLNKSCPGLVSFCTMECAKIQPLASLSRGTAGIRGTTLIVNLPGNPRGIHEIIPVLLPLTLHVVADMKNARNLLMTVT